MESHAILPLSAFKGNIHTWNAYHTCYIGHAYNCKAIQLQTDIFFIVPSQFKWTYLNKSDQGGRNGFLTDIFGIVSELLVLPRASPEVMLLRVPEYWDLGNIVGKRLYIQCWDYFRELFASLGKG